MNFFLIWLCLLLPLPALGAAPDLLPPEQAFQFSARLTGADTIEVRYRIAPGYYLYRSKFEFTAAPGAVRLGAPRLPAGHMKHDEFFGDVETYRGDVMIHLPVTAPAALPVMTLTAVSQGCADAGVCYVPQEQKVQLRLAGFEEEAGDSGSVSFPAGTGRAGAQDARMAALFAGGFWVLIASYFIFGLLLSFTPCMLPMIPILSGIIAGGGHRLSRGHGFALALAYVLGMALTYAVAGVAAGLSGAMLSAALQSPWVLGAFAAVFVALAAAMFGLYEFELPASLQSRLAVASNRLHGGHVAGVFSMGILSALIVGPCVAAPLAGALLYISQSRDVVLGGSALFAMALGMGVPLLAIGASAGALLPKAGPWMESVKRFFGVILLAVAIYLVSPLLSSAAQMLAWAVLLVMTAVYSSALDPLPPAAAGFDRFRKGIGVIALVAGIAFLVGALAGGNDVLRPLAGLRGGTAARTDGSPAVSFTRVESIAALDRAVAAAGGTPVMLDFYADWCVSCKEMERDTFTDPRVRQRLGQMVLLRADVTANTAADRALLERFRLFGPPGIIFFDRTGREIESVRAIGFQPAAEFTRLLERVLASR